MVGNGKKGKARVIDLCCGVGTSTRALREAFPDAVTVVGVDTSEQMIAMAHFLTDHLSFFKPILVEHLKFLKPFVKKVDIKLSTGYTVLNEQRSKFNKAVRGSFTRGAVTYTRSNAEDTKLPDKSFDLVTVFYAFHEAPQAGRAKILAEARRLLDSGGTLAVIDISPEFKPSKSMLSGEPYAIEYQQNIQRQLLTFNGFIRPEYKVLVPGQVVMWTMRRARNAFI
jgi:ubiquinone/menaquinone biosynthesis C-methylase UbiE